MPSSWSSASSSLFKALPANNRDADPTVPPVRQVRPPPRLCTLEMLREGATFEHPPTGYSGSIVMLDTCAAKVFVARNGEREAAQYWSPATVVRPVVKLVAKPVAVVETERALAEPPKTVQPGPAPVFGKIKTKH